MVEEEIKKHPKLVLPFSMGTLCDIAKTVRNVEMPTQYKKEVVYALAKYFEGRDPFFHKKRFINIGIGILNHELEAYRKYARKDVTAIS